MKRLTAALLALAGASLPATASIPTKDSNNDPLLRHVLSKAEREAMLQCVTRGIPGITLFELKSMISVRQFFSVADAELNRFHSNTTLFYQFYTAPAGAKEATEAVPLRLGREGLEIGFANLQTGQTFALPARVDAQFRACDAKLAR